jgi:hypothetical protein
LGVDQFFIADNDSSDGTTEFLLDQRDVRVFVTKGRFRDAKGGTEWLNALLHGFGSESWCLNVDADELLIYPGSEKYPLPYLVDHLDSQGYEALACLLLDLYPGGPIKDLTYRAGDDLIEAAPYFDPGPYVRIPVKECPGNLLVGGVRERVFYPEARPRTIARRAYTGLCNRFGRHIPFLADSGWFRKYRPYSPPCLTKVPLVRWDHRSSYLNVNHFISPKRVAAVTGVLLHLKFLQDFHKRAMQEAARDEYFDGPSEYKRYARVLATCPDMNLMAHSSARFKDSEHLVELGLMQDSEPWHSAGHKE